jgi:hypothetical protein
LSGGRSFAAVWMPCQTSSLTDSGERKYRLCRGPASRPSGRPHPLGERPGDRPGPGQLALLLQARDLQFDGAGGDGVVGVLGRVADPVLVVGVDRVRRQVFRGQVGQVLGDRVAGVGVESRRVEVAVLEVREVVPGPVGRVVVGEVALRELVGLALGGVFGVQVGERLGVRVVEHRGLVDGLGLPAPLRQAPLLGVGGGDERGPLRRRDERRPGLADRRDTLALLVGVGEVAAGVGGDVVEPVVQLLRRGPVDGGRVEALLAGPGLVPRPHPGEVGRGGAGVSRWA